MRQLRWGWLLLLLSLGACASIGLTPTKSADEQLAYVEAANTGLVKTIDSALKTHQITSAQAQHGLDLTDQIQTAVIAGYSAEGAADAAGVQEQLQVAQQLLDQLNTYLASKGVKTSGAK